jgi:hypothetical protein
MLTPFVGDWVAELRGALGVKQPPACKGHRLRPRFDRWRG